MPPDKSALDMSKTTTGNVPAPALSEQVVDGKKIPVQPAASAKSTETETTATKTATKPAATEEASTTATTTEESTETTASSEDPGEDATADAPKKSKGGFQKRIDELTKANKESQRQLTTALQALEKITGASATATVEKLDAQDPKPDRTTYDDPDKYAEELGAWSGRRAAAAAIAENEAKAKKANNDQAIERAQRTWEERQVAARAKYADYDDVAGRDDLEISVAMGYALTRMPEGAEIAYYLGKHPEEAERISALKDTAEQLVELGLVKAKLASAARPKVSKVPDPIKPVGAGNSATKPRSEMSMEEYAAARQPELDAQRRGRTGGRTH
jgi:hypothetical protein